MNMGNMEMLFKVKGAWDNFTKAHPKFPAFLNAVKNRGIQEGDIVAISITKADGSTLDTNIKVQPSDIEMFEMLKNLR